MLMRQCWWSDNLIVLVLNSWAHAFRCSVWQNGKCEDSMSDAQCNGPLKIKYLCDGELQAELATFFMEHHFYLKGKPTQYSNPGGYRAGIFSTMNRVRLTLQEKQLTIFVAHDKIWAFLSNIGILGTLRAPPWAWQNPNT